ncbi:MAG: DUF3168 domain-containing protein [Sphingomonadales bacterium]
MLHAASDLRAAVRAQLLAQTSVTDVVSGIYETTPAGAAFPYLTLGDERVRDWSTQTFQGSEHGLLINSWTDEESFASLKALHLILSNVLQIENIALQDHHLAVFFLEEERFLIDRKRRRRLGVLRYRALLHPATLSVPA